MEVTIERILPGGLGLAHADGQTIMVPLAAPGDHLDVRVNRVKGSVAFASIERIISPAESRVEPPCPYFGRCGGCDFQQLNYQAQLAAKIEIIKDCLRRIGGLEAIPEFQITAAPNPWHYRSRAQWQYDSIRKRLGYFESGSRRVCDVAECAVLVSQLQRALENLRARMRLGSLPDEVRYFRAIAGNESISMAPSVSGPPAAEPENDSCNDRVREPADPSDDVQAEITRMIRGETYRLNPESFFQTNVELLPQLIDGGLPELTGQTAIELYCGVGLFTLPLARRFRNVIGVEDHPDAADLARRNLKAAGLSNAQIVNRDVGDWLEKYLDGDDHAGQQHPPGSARPIEFKAPSFPDSSGAFHHVDFLLLDPPRAGAESRVISGMLRLQPNRICYVSCDPATLARDLKKLLAGGYTLDSLAAFDMFPQTHHVETVAHLRNLEHGSVLV
jgi:23S rRNA (uracil1939-C5)-methyltransferase